MTLGEFKAWFEGFSEGVEDRPNAKQWARIKEKVALIDGKAVEVREVIRWVPSWPPYPVIYNTWPSPAPYTPWQVDWNVTSSSTDILAMAGQNEAQSLS